MSFVRAHTHATVKTLTFLIVVWRIGSYISKSQTKTLIDLRPLCQTYRSHIECLVSGFDLTGRDP